MTPAQRRVFWLLLFVALCLRLQGLGWGLPSDLHAFSYHPDEWSQVLPALNMVESGDLNPHFFNYPSLSIDLTAVVFRVAAWVIPTAGNPTPFYLLARLLSVLAGVLTVVLSFAIAARLDGPRAGLFAAAAMAVFPLAVVNSHYATVDSLLALWVALALWASTALADRELDGRATWRWTIVGSLAVGLAAGTKYNGALALAPLMVGLALGRRSFAQWAAAIALCVVVFVVSSPYVFLDPSAAAQIRFELIEHPKSSNLYAGVGPGWLFHLRWNLPIAAGVFAPLMALIGIIRWVGKHQSATWPTVVWLAVAALSLTRTHELFIRYWLPLLPAVAVAAGATVGAEWVNRRGRWTWIALTLVVLSGPALRARGFAVLLSAPADPRNSAAQWCFQNLPAGAAVGEIDPTWFYSVPLRVNNGGVRTGANHSPSRFNLVSDPDQWLSQNPQYLVINDVQRLQRFGETPERWAELTANYQRVKTFEARAKFLPGWTQTGRGSRVSDWLYPLPVIEIWQRKSTS